MGVRPLGRRPTPQGRSSPSPASRPADLGWRAGSRGSWGTVSPSCALVALSEGRGAELGAPKGPRGHGPNRVYSHLHSPATPTPTSGTVQMPVLGLNAEPSPSSIPPPTSPRPPPKDTRIPRGWGEWAPHGPQPRGCIRPQPEPLQVTRRPSCDWRISFPAHWAPGAHFPSPSGLLPAALSVQDTSQPPS